MVDFKDVRVKSIKMSSILSAPSVYDERIKCLQNLIEIQKNLKSTDDEYLTVSMIEGKPHNNALDRLEALTNLYKKEYDRCAKM